jgi:hypothetical protein
VCIYIHIRIYACRCNSEAGPSTDER